eukprot:CAMPEP_0118652040 /NCGR_PEP_ID=MMETSP0785-20121206/11103_1 /TAXON_ID=91992 /ORGANISM="Bolidomonas pacifica, Strain CCMP 1866" /LENGTH=179 /DNA_ID=CAMNT_0006544525 /DNA_START=87 /DNA_END=624 /DNA_ORIENTATION=-
MPPDRNSKNGFVPVLLRLLDLGNQTGNIKELCGSETFLQVKKAKQHGYETILAIPIWRHACLASPCIFFAYSKKRMGTSELCLNFVKSALARICVIPKFGCVESRGGKEALGKGIVEATPALSAENFESILVPFLLTAQEAFPRSKEVLEKRNTDSMHSSRWGAEKSSMAKPIVSFLVV